MGLWKNAAITAMTTGVDKEPARALIKANNALLKNKKKPTPKTIEGFEW